MKRTKSFKKIASFIMALAMILLAIPAMEAKAAQNVTVHFKNTEGWGAVYAYYWDSAGPLLGAWPGTDITANVDGDYYSVTLEDYEGDSLNIIFGDGGSIQTVDLVCDTSKSAEWWVVPSDNSTGKWSCTVAATKEDAEAGNSDITTPGEPIIPENPTVKQSPVIDGNKVTFYFESTNSDNVVISGTMNDWSTDWTMTKEGNVFSYTCELEEGTYQYKYIVDGTWMADPFNPATADDGSGNVNSTFTVSASGAVTPGETEDTQKNEEPENTEDTSKEDQNTEDTSVEDTGKEDTTAKDEDDTQVSDKDEDNGGLSAAWIIVIAVIVTVVIVLGAFAGYMYFMKKKNK